MVTLHPTGLVPIPHQPRDVEAIFTNDAAPHVADGDDPCAGRGEHAGGVGADVAEALDDDAGALEWSSEVAKRLAGDDQQSTSGGRLATERAAQQGVCRSPPRAR